jgi:hypothetical protein
MSARAEVSPGKRPITFEADLDEGSLKEVRTPDSLAVLEGKA